MKSKKKCSTFTFYRADENKEGKLYYISFKFACLSLYIIGFYYVLLSYKMEDLFQASVNYVNSLPNNRPLSVETNFFLIFLKIILSYIYIIYF
ncbi:hypothetical protein PFFCH_01776 [Plasmodium falciparum FCH/4]|uniref:Uncharacterized protein n=1 Tax=Plasmodium falciparum FCH/4 TaxID=1036724 RepID=A0A024VRE7_PLAFA|nr:hypothetical protein PFFCH_01776 [Plasmodium falciparum FCH/4]